MVHVHVIKEGEINVRFFLSLNLYLHSAKFGIDHSVCFDSDRHSPPRYEIESDHRTGVKSVFKLIVKLAGHTGLATCKIC